MCNSSREYDTRKYQLIRTKSYALTVRAPWVLGTYKHSFPDEFFDRHLDIIEIKFLHQTDDNIIYGQEEQSTDISCITVPGDDAKELSIKKNGKTLAASNSSVVTFSFTPNRHDNFTRYSCVVKDPAYAEVYVKLVIICAPIFVTENRKVKFVVPGELFTISFLIYGNPVVEMVWKGMAGTDLTKAYRMHFGISKADLIYAASGENVNISGYEIVIETDIFRSNDSHEYTIWAGNKLGVDSYQFQILIDDQCYNEYSNQLIASGSIATVLLIYLFISHVWFCVRVRKKRTMQPNIQEPLNNHAYDEIGPITNQEVNGNPLTTGHQELNRPVIILQYPQDESATTNRNSQDPVNDSTDMFSTVSEQDFTMHDIRSTALHGVTTYEERISDDEASTSTDQDGVSEPFRTGNDQGSNIKSKDSTSSDESSGSTLGYISISDGYENPYQSMMPVDQEFHQYCDLTNIPEK
ncbi:unnamed protein product [Mytilus coruscus]|uniref:Uncharacterized protein n=1 Tax=Mytilus coruscus TaxID=42192 RepID=A0A6J8DV11_MYTCO|nr:unnamed protein product [Mytilus coruscus]